MQHVGIQTYFEKIHGSTRCAKGLYFITTPNLLSPVTRCNFKYSQTLSSFVHSYVIFVPTMKILIINKDSPIYGCWGLPFRQDNYPALSDNNFKGPKLYLNAAYTRAKNCANKPSVQKAKQIWISLQAKLVVMTQVLETPLKKSKVYIYI